MKMNVKSAAMLLPALLIATPILAATAGQIEGGDIYRVKNVTQNIDFTDTVNAKACDVVQFKVRIHNPGPDALENVMVKATMPAGTATSFSSQVTVSADNANPETTTDTAGVKLAEAGTLSYVAGSTELLDQNGNKLSNLADGILAGGVNAGTVGVSIQQKRYVQFQEKVNCPTPPVVTPPVVTPPVVTPPVGGGNLPETGAELALGGMLGTGVAGYAVMQYRRSRKALSDSLRNR